MEEQLALINPQRNTPNQTVQSEYDSPMPKKSANEFEKYLQKCLLPKELRNLNPALLKLGAPNFGGNLP